MQHQYCAVSKSINSSYSSLEPQTSYTPLLNIPLHFWVIQTMCVLKVVIRVC